MLKRIEQEGNLNKAFIIALYLKGIDGSLEIIGSVLLFFLKREELGNIIRHLTQHELFGFRHNFIANKLWELFDKQTVKLQLFQAIYLLGHGLVKLLLVWGLLKKIIPAYYAGIIIISAFIIYQLYRWTHTHSIALTIFTTLDILILILIIRELIVLKRKI